MVDIEGRGGPPVPRVRVVEEGQRVRVAHRSAEATHHFQGLQNLH